MPSVVRQVEALVLSNASLVRRNAVLQGRLAALEADLSEEPPPWGEMLSPNELAAMYALATAYPKPLNRLDLDAAMEQRDRAVERDLKGIDVVLRKVRIKLGADAIVTLKGRGWRCSAAFAAKAKTD